MYKQFADSKRTEEAFKWEIWQKGCNLIDRILLGQLKYQNIMRHTKFYKKKGKVTYKRALPQAQKYI